jgi:hypothetical protein
MTEQQNPHYVTPDESADMACPQRFHLSESTGKAYSGECIGPQCMAWRWRIDKYEYNPPDDAGFPVKTYSTTHGYCGMVRP